MPEYTITPTTFNDNNVFYRQLHIKHPYHLYLKGDSHPGNPLYLQNFHENILEEIESRNNTGMIEMGDIGEFNNKDSPESAMHEQVWNNKKQLEYIKQKHRPLAEKGKIWALTCGNHDGERSRKTEGTSRTRDIAEILDVPYIDISAYIVIDINNKYRLTLYINHGKRRTTGTNTGTRRKMLREKEQYSLADIVCIGHKHKLEFDDLYFFDDIKHEVVINPETMQMTTQPKIYKKRLITGHFLDYFGGYGQRDAYPPEPAGFPILHIHPDGFYEVEFVWENERKIV